jgi:hypothetical protein
MLYIRDSVGYFIRKNYMKWGMIVYTCNPTTQEAEAGGSWVQGQLGLHSETTSQKKELYDEIV